jgi:ParB family chromosome partitioning protein
MAARKAAAKKATGARKVARKTSRKAEPGSQGLDAASCALDPSSPELATILARVRSEGGQAVGSYRDPLGGKPLVVAILPIDAVAPTPFQRDLSDAHHKRLADVIQKTARFLDPIIAVTAPERGFWTPNGRHRLAAMQRLGARAVTALVVPDREVAWQILALNTEKAHNLKERALEVVRIYRGLIDEDASRAEESFAFYLEDPALVTLGVCYEKAPRFAGGAYHPILRRVEKFSDEPLRERIAMHERVAEKTLALEEAVSVAIERLKERGMKSPYLRAFVVSRINPLPWIKGELPEAEPLLEQMRAKAARFDAGKVKQEDLARVAGVPDEDA